MLQTLKKIFQRDLTHLHREIDFYENEDDLWKIAGAINNSAGNLCLHLIGNLNTYIGAELGQTGYIRNRPLEFSLKNIPKHELLQKIEETKQIVLHTLDNLEEEHLKEEYPVLVFEQKTSTEYFLFHLTTHLAYHLGQINYHRRLIKIC